MPNARIRTCEPAIGVGNGPSLSPPVPTMISRVRRAARHRLAAGVQVGEPLVVVEMADEHEIDAAVHHVGPELRVLATPPVTLDHGAWCQYASVH